MFRKIAFSLVLWSAHLAGALQQPPPLASLTGLPRTRDAEQRDVPAITNFFGSVGSSPTDVVGLSQVMLPPYLDVGVPTATLSLNAHKPTGCRPEDAGAWSIAGTEQYFKLESENETARLYSVFCTTACSTSWHTATAASVAPFLGFHIVYDMQPGFKNFSDTGLFDASCSVIEYSGGDWCALSLNPSCTPVGAGVPLEGWQFTPTGVMRWGGPASSETRMLFEGNGVLQRVRVAAGEAPLAGASLALTGAVQKVKGMSWITQPQGNTDGYSAQITSVGAAQATALLTCRADTQSVCAAWVVASSSAPLNASLAGETVTLDFAPVAAGAALELELALVIAETPADTLALAATLADGGGFALAWDAFADGWAERWADAFTPKPAGGGSGHFSGSLPVLTLDESPEGSAISRLYYMGAFAILQAERTNLPLVAPRVFVTGTGNELCGISVGGSEQWAWDQTFYGLLQTLLDPNATRADLSMWVGQPVNSLTGITLDDLSIQGGFYAFNAVSLYRVYSTYLRATGDAAFLASTGSAGAGNGETVDTMLDVLADFFLPYCKRANSTLADYSASPAVYLECVPTYVHATAGLQGGNAFIARDLADLRAAQGNATRAAELRARADAIEAESIPALYVSNTSGARGGDALGDVGGWWRVLDTGDGSGTREVRHIVDFAYSAFGFCSQRWPPCALNASVRAQMGDFFARQLVVPGGAWTRALSALDGAAPISRPDHGSTGSYAAWPAMAFDALTALAGFNASVPFLAALRGADEGPFGQAHGIAGDGASVFKTTGGCNRYIANNVASFAESVLRVLFGYEPQYFAQADPQPANAAAPRAGLRGTLSCVRGPSIGGAAPRYATATLTDAGVEFAWADACS